MFLLLVSVTFYRCIARHSKLLLPHFSFVCLFFVCLFVCLFLFFFLCEEILLKNLVEKLLLASICKLSCIFLIRFKMWVFSGDIFCLRLLHFITLLFIIGKRI